MPTIVAAASKGPLPSKVNGGAPITIGLIGGSKLHEMPGFTDKREVALDTPFGGRSDDYIARKRREHVYMCKRVFLSTNSAALPSFCPSVLPSLSLCPYASTPGIRVLWFHKKQKDPQPQTKNKEHYNEALNLHCNSTFHECAYLEGTV